MSWLYVNSNRSMILAAAVENNKQIVKKTSTTRSTLCLGCRCIRSTIRPFFQIMRKDYETALYPLYEREKDYDTVGGIIRNSMLLYTDLIDSAVIYQSRNHIIVGRSNNEYMDHRYLENEFYNEPYVQKILQKQGLYVAVGVHPEKLVSYSHVSVVSVARAIVDPYSKENLGLIMLNIGIDKLKLLWSDIHFTENTKFYLIDENKKYNLQQQRQ